MKRKLQSGNNNGGGGGEDELTSNIELNKTARMLALLFSRPAVDAYVWGSAPRGSTTSIATYPYTGTNSAVQSNTKWPQSAIPTVSPGNTCVDAAYMSIGRRHAVMTSFGGHLFTFGQGKLGMFNCFMFLFLILFENGVAYFLFISTPLGSNLKLFRYR